jgi:tetratricopeptide (TPR) repeat protein
MKLFKSILIFFLLSINVSFGQNAYKNGCKAVNEGEIEKAISFFEEVIKGNENKSEALLYLSMLYTGQNNDVKSGAYFKKFFSTASDPYPAIFSLWFDDGVIGESGKKNNYQLELLNSIYESENDKLKRASIYRLYNHYLFSNDKKTAAKYAKELTTMNNWSVVGPFDNVVNSGFDKDFGVLNGANKDAVFDSKYGAKVGWFVPPMKSKDGYYIMDANFKSENSIMYAQSFVKSESQADVMLSVSYSGSLKIWINDQEIYAERSRRKTELYQYKFKMKLNNGFNRILLQLGDYKESYANFNLLLTDQSNSPIDYIQEANYQPYIKTIDSVKEIEHFALSYFIEKIKKDPNDQLSKILLAKAHMRSLNTQAAENIYREILVKEPNNYFALIDMIGLYSETGNATGQNKFYGIFEKVYPKSYDILTNDLDEAYQNKNEAEFEKLLPTYLEKYPNEYLKLYQEGRLAYIKEDYKKYLEILEKTYEEFPDDYIAMASVYELQKSHYKNSAKAKKILLKYLEGNNNYDVLKELSYMYVEDEEFDKSIKLLKESSEYFDYDIQSLKYIVNILSGQGKYQEAIDVCNEIIERVPMEYTTTHDIAKLAMYIENENLALDNYKKTNEYFPFSFEANEKIRELSGKKKAIDMLPEIEIGDIIKDYEENMKTDIKKSYDIVFESKSRILYKSTAGAKKHEYIIRINDESALKDWQQINFSSGGLYDTYINEVVTVKPSGEKIVADRNEGKVVFTNLEVGDYIYVSYSDYQVNGGKTAKFISERFSLNSVYPIFRNEYNLLVEEGLTIIDTTISNDLLKPIVNNIDGILHYKWARRMPKPIEDENYKPLFNDLTEKLHFSVNKEWDEIVQWYRDLSSHQATPDYTINNLSKELFDGKDLGEEEKFKAIYDFVIDNIQYSSVDFRQSSYIPQKASNTYQSRLGDCKDLSTLFVSLARASGLKANLVLINTDNSKKSVVQPSLNFNHCIVKTYSESGNKYLELTSNNLPYGYLAYYHEGAPILEIPHGEETKSSELEYLIPNKGYTNIISRETNVTVNKDGSMDFLKKALKTGVKAKSMCDSYCEVDETKLAEEFKDAIVSDFNSDVIMNSVQLNNVAPRQDSVTYSYSFKVKNDVIKLGKLRTVKIPFTDFIINMEAFKETNRQYDFNFPYYEVVDEYHESIDVELSEGQVFKDIPANMSLDFNGTKYFVLFKKISSSKLRIERSYTANREMIKRKDYEAFKSFAEKVTEAESMQLLFE